MCLGCNAGVTPCGRQREDRVIGIVKRVNDVMRRARMVRVLLVDSKRYRARLRPKNERR